MDDLFKKLADAPIPARLAQLDDAVLARLSAWQSEAHIMSRLLSAAAVLALGIGYAGGNVMPAPASATENNLVLAENALAPSTLLDFL